MRAKKLKQLQVQNYNVDMKSMNWRTLFGLIEINWWHGIEWRIRRYSFARRSILNVVRYYVFGKLIVWSLTTWNCTGSSLRQWRRRISIAFTNVDRDGLFSWKRSPPRSKKSTWMKTMGSWQLGLAFGKSKESTNPAYDLNMVCYFCDLSFC